MFKIQAQESLKIIKDDQDLLKLKIGIGIEKGAPRCREWVST